MPAEDIQICSALYPLQGYKITPDTKIIAADIRTLGRLAQIYSLRVAYEAPSWGIHKNIWQHIQEILDLVNLPNVGHCLEITFEEAMQPGDSLNTKGRMLNLSSAGFQTTSPIVKYTARQVKPNLPATAKLPHGEQYKIFRAFLPKSSVIKY